MVTESKCYQIFQQNIFLNEFNPEMEVISGKMVNGKIEIEKVKLTDLLPKAFGPKNLKM